MTRHHVVRFAMCLLASAGYATATTSFTEDAVCVVQTAMTGGDHLTVEHEEARVKRNGKEGSDEVSKPMRVVSDRSVEPTYCAGQIQMDVDRAVLTNNLGGLASTTEDPVIHIQQFVDLQDGTTADLVISNLSEYKANNYHLNGLKGEFNNVNIVAGSVDLLFTFLDTVTQLPIAMPPFNMTIYDLDGPLDDLYAETVSVCTDDFTEYKLTSQSDVIVTTMGNKTNFGSSSWGLKCDNPTSIESVGPVSCTTGPLDQKDRAVALAMKGNQSDYRISLTASAVAVVGRNFLFGLPAYFDIVCHAPTPSPTPAPPTSPPTKSPTSDVATSFGDPHVSNLKGERFDILQADYHTFLVIPRGADKEHALLHVVAKVDPLGHLCSGLLYVTSLKFSGRWMGDVGSLEFTTSVDAAMEAEKTMKIKTGASSYINASQFKEAVPQSLAELSVLQPEKPQSLNQHVDLLLVKLKLGPSIAKVRMVYQKEKVGFSNSLWLTTSGLGHVHEEIGGILGFDDHRVAARSPKECADAGKSAKLVLPGSPRPHGSIHASASFEDLDA